MAQFTDPAVADATLHGNMERVFNETDATKRQAAMKELWSAAPIMFEPKDVLEGREAISANVDILHARLPAGTRFTPAAPVEGHHDFYVLPWQAAVPGQPPHTLGRDVALLKDGVIDRFWIFIDKRL